MRIDFIKVNGLYMVLEIELIDPMLFLNTITDKKERKNIYNNFAMEIKKKICEERNI